MREFDARTATQAEFEAEARRTHAEVVARIDAMTENERQAAEWGNLDRYLREVSTLRLNQISSLAGLEENLATTVGHWKNDTWQSSDEYMAAFDEARSSGDFEGHMAGAKAEYFKRFETAKPEAGHLKAEARLVATPEEARAAAEDKVNDLARTRSKRKTRAILGDLLEELKVA
ncbi:MAG: hypothetical protein F4X97_00145 [Boseongicola sp. SB0662_bin_57]|nr:hypothetical protein [Boseongicola sp. SB0662_bin_57]